jgi:regulator of PEP synthase PpsR (kinase-PPPase family)
MHAMVSQGRPPDRSTGELPCAEALYELNRVPVIDSSAKLVGEMATIILRAINRPR